MIKKNERISRLGNAFVFIWFPGPFQIRTFNFRKGNPFFSVLVVEDNQNMVVEYGHGIYEAVDKAALCLQFSNV